jgi:hypothetical protein
LSTKLLKKFMRLVSNNIEKELKKIPDFNDWNKALKWINKGLRLIQQCSEKDIFDGEIFFLEWKQIEEPWKFPFGLFQSKSWRKFVLATFCADLISYNDRIEQVDFERLLFVMHAFPQGFRTWWVKLLNGTCWPVGYTGWYPMLETTFELFQNNPSKLKNRMVVPNVQESEGRPYLYLFNFSVAQEFKKTFLTKVLIKTYIDDIQMQNAAGLSCITVSKDGIRIAERLDMSHKGDLLIDGYIEGIYVKRFN